MATEIFSPTNHAKSCKQAGRKLACCYCPEPSDKGYLKLSGSLTASVPHKTPNI
ncbi:hypothetical protein EIKCOROL_01253 [Eikenella corrodens ATCC 23834]|uniref:Uncharacterized protein n=1 Tax=Eikenella corrodens ATCC 23834 TaxID=546274 RepID=C0DV64_EIKCO|nr:hypothetical protein EIKCOROL_01253 [Eikenella corrodens ATCC 23834]